MTHLKKNSRRKVLKAVFACAWCPPSTYAELRVGEGYSHGICQMHKTMLLQSVHRPSA